MSDPRQARFARHENGIPVSLCPEEIVPLDKCVQGQLDLSLGGESPFDQARIRETARLVGRHLAAGGRLKRLLDAGCGTGPILAALRARFPSFDAIGLDVSLRALQCAAGKLPGVDLVLSDICRPPLHWEYFDCILLNNVIEHVEAPISILRSVNRLLAPGGCLIVSTPSRYRLENILNAAIGRPLRLMAADHVTEYSVGQVVDLLRFAGFEVLEVSGPRRRPRKRTLRNTVSHGVVKRLMQLCLNLTKSLHVMEPTAFFLAYQASHEIVRPAAQAEDA